MQNRKADHLESQVGCPRQRHNLAMAKSQTCLSNCSTAQDGFDFWEDPLKTNLAGPSHCATHPLVVSPGVLKIPFHFYSPFLPWYAWLAQGTHQINTSTTFFAGILQILYMHIFLQIKMLETLVLHEFVWLQHTKKVHPCILVGSTYLQ